VAQPSRRTGAEAERLVHRRQVCLLVARLGLAVLGLLAVVATIAYAQLGSLPVWFTATFVVLLVFLGMVCAISAATPCPSCGRDPDSGWAFGMYSQPSRQCKHCGAELYGARSSTSEPRP
jgi:hypothetical protein